MPIIPSNPTVATVNPAHALTFAIPSGVWASGTWSITATCTGAGTDHIKTSPSNSSVSFAAHGASGYSDAQAVTAGQLADINAAAGANLGTLFDTTAAIGTVSMTSLTLTLVGSGGSTVVAGSITQINTLFDSPAGEFQGSYTSKGLGAATESGTGAALALRSRKRIMGDGVQGSQFPGLGNAAWQAILRPYLDSLTLAERWDIFYAAKAKPLITTLDAQIGNNLPKGWKFVVASGATHFSDAHLTRLNGGYGASAAGNDGTHALATPTVGTLTAAFANTGTLPVTASGNAPFVVHTLIGAQDYNESLPSAEATQVAIAAPNNAYTYQIAGTVPAGVKKVRLYRSAFGDATGGAKYWDQDVAVTPGSSYPAMTIQQPDALLRMDWNPPSWLSVVQTPEAAILFALAYATAPNAPSAAGMPLLLQASGMLSPGNVALNPSAAFLGYQNPAQSGQFAQLTLPATFLALGIQTANVAAAGLQGFGGGMGLQFRVTTAFNGSAVIAVTYTYYDAAHGWGNAQTDSSLTATLPTNAPVGTVAGFAVPAGRSVQTVTAASLSSGTATTGAGVFESPAVRSL